MTYNVVKEFGRVFVQRWLFFLAGIMLLQPIDGQAYEEPLHTYMSELAAENSVLAVSGSSSIWKDWGIPISQEFPNSGEPSPEYGPRATNMNFFRLIGFGADVEDTNTDVGDFSHRSLNHFFNPQSGSGNSLGEPSPLWALEDVRQIFRQNYSLFDTSRYFYRSFSASTIAVRNENTGRMFQSLGHVIHHIQDMAQPEHARNDEHCSDPLCKLIDDVILGQTGSPPPEPRFDPSGYEEYTRGLFDCGAFFAPNHGRRFQCTINGWPVSVQGQSLEGHDVPKFDNPRDFWTNAASQGMADFTSLHFVSKDTNFTGFSTNASDPEGIQVFPGVNQYVDVQGVNPTPAPAGNAPESVLSVVSPPQGAGIQVPFQHYVGGNFQDPISGTGIFNNAVSLISVLGVSLAKNNQPVTLTMDRNVWDEARRLLLPRAVAYSTGLINHFFEARISMEEVPQNIGRSKWIIRNTGAIPISGDVEVHSDNSSGIRTQVPNALYPVSLPPNGSVEVDGFASPINANGNFVAILASTKFNQRTAQAAYQFTYNAQPLAQCGNTLTRSGSSETFEQELLLGEEAGIVAVDFQAYPIPDSLTITNPQNGRTFYSTDGLVSDRHVFKFRFDPVAENTDRVSVRVVGNENPRTRWRAEVSCPDLDEDLTFQHRVLFRLDERKQNPLDNIGLSSICEGVLRIDATLYAMGVGNFPITSPRPPRVIRPFLYEGEHDVVLQSMNCGCIGPACGNPGTNYVTPFGVIEPFDLQQGNSSIRIFVNSDGSVTIGAPAPPAED